MEGESLSASIENVQQTIDLLRQTREAVVVRPETAPMTLAKLQNTLKKKFNEGNDKIKTLHNALNHYSKTLQKNSKALPLPTSEYDALSSHPDLINRAIAMHLVREGQFEVASTFLHEVVSNPPKAVPTPGTPFPNVPAGGGMDMNMLNLKELQRVFADMYQILDALRDKRDLTPAIEWARSCSDKLEQRGSNLEFELGRLQFIWFFLNDNSPDGSIGLESALHYARSQFGRFQQRYLREIKRLSGAMAYRTNLQQSPYSHLFHDSSAWDDIATSFTREYCALIGLSADSPLYIAATAGAIALPTLLKLASIMREKKTEWTTQNELPVPHSCSRLWHTVANTAFVQVEIPLPLTYQFHSIFVCPVSKEQSTEQNPPMMMPCGHVIAKESLLRLSKQNDFKCPYCPSESHPREAKRVFM
ncbi:MAG: hypothetical protein M1825_000469 [Sarcosagium campestre]|nr:MAG: hypothetical protein M1825_000469 [Sarcosagium campestre]